MLTVILNRGLKALNIKPLLNIYETEVVWRTKTYETRTIFVFKFR